LNLVATQIAREVKLVQLGSEIQSQVESEMAHGQREYFLREQMKQSARNSARIPKARRKSPILNSD